MAEKKRLLYLDMLNIAACFCVVWMHCNSIVHSFSDTPVWRQSMVVETVAYWAVPVFFMLSGATLMNYRSRYTTKQFFLRRFLRVGIPYLFWSGVMLIWKLKTEQMALPDRSIRTLLTLFLDNRIEPIYWFFFPLFMVYCAMPVLSLLKDNRRCLWYMTGAAFLTGSLLPIVFQALGLHWNGALGFPAAGGTLLYVLLGYLLSTAELSRAKRLLIYAGGLLAAVGRYGITYALSLRDGTLNRLLFNSMGFPAVLLGAAVFVLFRQLPWEWLFRPDWTRRAIAAVSSCSFGIYLIQMIVIYYAKQCTGLTPERFLWRTAGAVGVYLVSLLLVWLMKRIPLLGRWLLP